MKHISSGLPTKEKLARDKKSSLSRTFLNNGYKKFYNIGPSSQSEKHFSITIDDKLVWLSFAALSNALAY